jgi:CBS domain-containing protein
MNKPTTISVATLKNLVTIDVDEAATQGFRLMKKYNIRHLPVTEGAEIIGMLSTRDLTRALNEESRFLDWNELDENNFNEHVCAGELMSWPVKTLDIRSELTHVLELMISEKLSSVILTQQDGRVAGIISTEDMLRAFWKLLSEGDNSVKEKVFSWIARHPLNEFVRPLAESGI